MPREVVHTSNPEPFQPFRLSIGWQRDQDVQVGIQVENSDLVLTDILFGKDDGPSGHTAQLGRRLVDRLVLGGYMEEPVYATQDAEFDDLSGWGLMVLELLAETRAYVERDGVWLGLDRQQINDAIRHLRRARNEAYGKDE